MKRSLKLRLFLTIFFMATLMVMSNRYFAQYKATVDVTNELHQEMEKTILACYHETDEAQLALCQRRFFKNHLFNRYSGGVTLCQNGQVVAEFGQNQDCRLLADHANFWTQIDSSKDSRVQLIVHRLGDQVWHVARLKEDNSLQLMASETSIQKLLTKLWQVRDNQLPLFFPILLAMVLIMATLLIRSILNPLNALKASLENLTPEKSKLEKPIQSIYKEFDAFVNVYNDLLKRLDSSFTKAKRFSADAAHELRTPFTILRGQAEELINDSPVGSALQIRLRNMADEIDRLIAMSEKLLLLSRADANAMDTRRVDFDLSAFMNELAEESITYHPNLNVKKDITPDLIWHCNRGLAQQLIHNLYSNSVKYNIPNGWLKMTLRNTVNALEVSFENPSKDIPKDLSEKAFDRFYRGDEARAKSIEGMGLGLSICKEIANFHQAFLTLEVTSSESVKLRLTIFKNPKMTA